MDAANDGLNVTRRVRGEIEAQRFASTVASSLEITTRAVKLAADALSDAFRINPGYDATVGAVIDAVDNQTRALRTRAKIIKAFENREDPQAIGKMLLEEAADIVGKKALSSNVTAPIKALYHFHNNAAGLVRAGTSWQIVLADLRRLLDQTDERIRVLQADLAKSRDGLIGLNEIKNTIDSLCSGQAGQSPSGRMP